MNRMVLFLSGILMLLLAMACSAPDIPATTTADKTQAEKPAPVASSRQPWEEQWETALKAARKENRVVIYGTQAESVRAVLSQNLKEKFGITLEFVAGTGSELVEKILFQRKADLNQVDIFMGGNINIAAKLKPAGALEPLKAALILPEVTDPKVWWSGQLLWLNPQDALAIAWAAYPSIPIFINTGTIRAEEIKSHWDLLNVKWKGKIIMGDPTIPGAASNWFANYGYEIPGVGLDFMRQLVKQDLVLTRDMRQHAEWVARGKYPIALAPRTEPMLEFKSLGSPIQGINPTEGTFLTPGPGYVAIIDKAPHLNAARVFINWLLTKEGQVIQSRTSGLQSARLDVPSDFLNPEIVRDPRVKYLWEGTEESALSSAARMKVAAEIFAPK